MMPEEICTYEVAMLAKEKGFDEPTLYAYDKESRRLARMRYCVKRNSRTEGLMTLAAPTQSLLQRWLREEKKVHIEIAHNPMYGGFMPYICKIVEGEEGVFTLLEKNSHCIAMRNATYENALEAGLKYALKNLIL